MARTQDISSGVFRYETAARVSLDTYKERVARAEPSFGDLLYSREGTYFGIAAQVPRNVAVCLGQRMVLIRSDPGRLDHRFLRYWLNSKPMSDYVSGHKDGSVAQRLNLPTIRGLPIPVPPLPEQRGIAATLGALDDKIESNRRERDILRQLGKAKVLAALAKAAPRRVILTDLTTSISRGVTPKYADDDPSAPLVINQKCVRDSWVSVELARRMIYREVATSKMISDGDILVNSTGTGTLGRVGRWHSGSVFADSHVSIVKPDTTEIGSTVLAYLLFDRESDIEAMATGSTGQTELSPTRLGELPIEIPGRSVASDLEKILIAIENRAASLRDEELRLATLRDTLLPELLSGRIRVPEAQEALAKVGT